MIEYSENDFKIDELGSFYSKEKTIFKVFSPSSKEIKLILNDKEYQMNKVGYSFETEVKGDHHLEKYYYLNDKEVPFKDPFSYYSDRNYSYILDTSRFIKEKITPKKEDNVIIYETSVRDFSCDDSFTGNNKRKLLALVESGLKYNGLSIGLDYLKELGITYLQLMPILDFDLDKTDYNWGYNPLAFNYLYSGYIVDDKNPYAFINEFRKVVNELHKNNLRITLDVVFNHVFKIHEYDLHKMIPGHIFRKKDNGTYAKGTLCGNEVKTEDPFVRAYFIEMVKRYIKLFDIDGIRIDQMGTGDYETVDQIYIEANKIKNNFLVYGEGWNMGDALDEDKRAAIINAHKIRNIGMFNDYFRDNIINHFTGFNDYSETIKSILSGDNNNMIHSQMLNYVECHDNYTFFDRMYKYYPNDLENNIKRCKLALGLVVLSRGIPFIHSGQEFLRTKNMINNSYNKPESVNRLDWKRRVEYKEICDYLKDLIEIRKNNSAFIEEKPQISFSDYNECIVYYLNDLVIVINGDDKERFYNNDKEFEVLLDSFGKKHYFNDTISLPPYSLVVLKK